MESKILICKKVLKCLKFGLQGGKFGRYTLCDAIYTCFQTFQSLTQKTKKFLRVNYFENLVSAIHKNNFFPPIIRQRLGTLLYLLVFISFYFNSFALFLKVFLWTYQLFCDKSENSFCLFCNLHSKTSRHMCQRHHKVRNGPILPP